MAKILSPVWSIIRGSIGGTTYFAGPTGQIIARARTAPVDPGTLFQTLARNAMDDASSVWENLPAAEQTLWDTYALTVTYNKATGSYSPTGRQALMAGRSLQRYMATRGLETPTLVQDAPLTTGLLLPTQINMIAPVGIGIGFGIALRADLIDDTMVMVNVAGPFSKERHFWKGPWDTLATVSEIVPANTLTVIDRLGLQLNRTYFARVKCVADDASPRVSAEFFLRGIAIETGP